MIWGGTKLLPEKWLDALSFARKINRFLGRNWRVLKKKKKGLHWNWDGFSPLVCPNKKNYLPELSTFWTKWGRPPPLPLASYGYEINDRRCLVQNRHRKHCSWQLKWETAKSFCCLLVKAALILYYCPQWQQSEWLQIHHATEIHEFAIKTQQTAILRSQNYDGFRINFKVFGTLLKNIKSHLRYTVT